MKMQIEKKRTERAIPVKSYSRISGYFMSTGEWNLGKLSELEEREMLSKVKIRKFIENGNTQKHKK